MALSTLHNQLEMDEKTTQLAMSTVNHTKVRAEP